MADHRASHGPIGHEMRLASSSVLETAGQPSYLELHRTGELQARARMALTSLAACRVCPRNCEVDRLGDKQAVCKSGRYARVASFFPHHGEEDCLRGWRGSGTIFFAGCNLRCVFCQNFDISQGEAGRPTPPSGLAGMMLELQARGCHNINFVTPEHVVPQILEALPLAVEAGLRLPLVYNTSGYDSLESLRLLEGVIDIYMPDFKVWDEAVALRLLRARDYPEVARQALREMQRQVGELVLDEQCLARRGLLVRHLVMPQGLAGTADVARFLATEISPNTYLNLMAQYRPAGRVSTERYAEINRPVNRLEWEQADRQSRESGLVRFDAPQSQ